jgi:TPR repeat protein
MKRKLLLIAVFLGLLACPLAGQDPETLRFSCDAGDATACVVLGHMYQTGEGVTQDLARAVILYQQACEGGLMQGCVNLGIMTQQRECDSGLLRVCVNLGFMYYTGEGVVQDLARAVGLYRQACDGGVVLGCNNLGAMYDAGEGVIQDLARAVSLYRQACDGGEMQGCANLGVMYGDGRGVARDSARAMSLYRQACDSGVMQGCLNLRDAADRLFDRVMRAVAVGDSAQAGALLPMAIAAYQRARPLDHDALYHLSVLQRNGLHPIWWTGS